MLRKMVALLLEVVAVLMLLGTQITWSQVDASRCPTDGVLNVQFTRRYVGETQIIDLERCGIHTIEDGAFHNLTTITILDLTSNKISQIGNSTFESLSNLNTLDLYNNNISHIENGTFESLSNLNRLSLSNNKISHIESGTFESLSNLNILYLDNNKISHIESGTFASLSSLTYLNLRSNNLQSLPQDFKSINGCVRLEYNPLHCNCQLNFLKLYKCYKTLLTCMSPTYRTVLYKDIDFRCQIPTTPYITSHASGSRITVQCASEGDPAPILDIVTPSGSIITFNPPNNKSVTTNLAVLDGIHYHGNGVYTCRAYNLMGSYSSTMNVQTRATIRTQTTILTSTSSTAQGHEQSINLYIIIGVLGGIVLVLVIVLIIGVKKCIDCRRNNLEGYASARRHHTAEHVCDEPEGLEMANTSNPGENDDGREEAYYSTINDESPYEVPIN